MADNISVILRVKNEENFIGYCIQSILDKINFPEIIIINDHSSDESIPIVKHFIRDKSLNSKDNRYTKIEIIDIDNYTPGKALNLGVNNSSNKYLLIISAHCKLINFKLNQNFELLEKYNAIFGKQIPIWNGKKISKRYIWSHFIDEEKINYYSEQEERYFFHNAFSFYKKSTLIDNPFNEQLSSKEDRYWANKIIDEKKMSTFYYPQNIVEHYYTPNGASWKTL